MTEAPQEPIQPITGSGREGVVVSATATGPGRGTRLVSSANLASVRILRVVVLGASDFFALVAAGSLGYLAWARPVRGQSPELYLSLVPLLTLFLAGYALSGLYPGFGLGPVETLRRLSRVTVFGFIVVAAITFAIKLPHLYSRVTFAITLVLALVGVPASRWLVAVMARGWPAWREPVLVVGDEEPAARAIDSLRELPGLGYQPVGIIRIEAGAPLGSDGGLPVVGDLAAAARLARDGIRVAVVAVGTPLDRAAVDRLQQHFHQVITLHGVAELPVEGVQTRNLGRVLGIEYTNNLLRRRNRLVKRTVDLMVGGAALALTSPVIVITALAVKLTDRGPAFFVQTREGLDGRSIRVPKVRTMRVRAEALLEEFLRVRPHLRRQWEQRMKLEDDPRLLPRIGRVLRRFSLDELPQLWSVLKGDMSLVGPRPLPEYHLRLFSPAFRRLRRRVRPGVTGYWQVTIRSTGTVAEQEVADSYYIRNWSLWLDIYILARTLGAVLRGKGAF